MPINDTQYPDSYYVDEYNLLLKHSGDPDRNRVDGDEQLIGSAVAHGTITQVLNAHSGVVRVELDSGDEITATIDGYYVPQPRIGSSVRVLQTPTGRASATPTYPVYPANFEATITSGQNGNTDGYHSAAARHNYVEFGTTAIAVIGAIGVSLDTDDVVLCAPSAGADKAFAGTSAPITHIYAIAKIRSA